MKFDAPWKVSDVLWVFILEWAIIPLALLFAISKTRYLPWVSNFAQAFKNEDVVASFVFDTISSALGLIVIIWFVKRYGAGLRDLGLRGFNWQRALGYLAVTFISFIILVSIAFAVVSILVPSFNADQPQVNEFTKAAADPATRKLAFAALVVIPAIFEEIIFRGFIFPAFATRWGTVAGALLSSFMFGLAHLQGNVGVYTVVLGLLLCLMYVKLRSIVPGIFLHMLNNYLAFMAITK